MPWKRLTAISGICSLVCAGLATLGAAPALAANVTASPVGLRAGATRLDFPVGDRVDATIDVGTGNLSVTTADIKLPGISSDLQLGMDFNSLLLSATDTTGGKWAGAGGYGWAARFGDDTRLIRNSDATIVYQGPDGLQGTFTPSGTNTYTSPVGFKTTLTGNTTSGWTLIDHASMSTSTFSKTGVLTKVTDRNGQATTYQAQVSGLDSYVTSTRGGAGSKSADYLHDTSGHVTKITQGNDVSGSRSVTYGYTGGQLSSIVDTGGRTTTFGYTGATSTSGGDLTSIVAPGGGKTVIAYDSSHRVTSITRKNIGGTDATTRLAYPSGTQTIVAGPNTDQASAVTAVPNTTYNLDSSDRATSSVDAVGRHRSATYTPFSDVASATSPSNSTTGATYTSNNGESLTKVTSPTGSTASLSYGLTGNSQYLPSGGTDSQGNTSSYSYDGAGNQLQTANQAGAVAKVSYNPDGTLATSTSPSTAKTTYTENTNTHVITDITPPSGSTLGATHLTYDGYSRLATVKDGRGDTTTYGYDGLDRVTQISYTGPDTATTSIGYVYDNAGNLKTRTDTTGTTTYGYDGLNRLNSRADGANVAVSYTYDPAGNLASNTNGAGTATYAYDAANRLLKRTNPGGSVNRYQYNNPDGQRTDNYWRANAATTTFLAHTRTSYDTAGRLTETWTSSASNDATKTFDTTYCYSPYVTGQACPTTTTSTDTGLIRWSTDKLTGTVSTYTYDTSNRLTDATNVAGHTYHYGYDTNGNRTTTKTDGATTQTLTVNTASNELTTTGYTYDTAGNLTHDPAAGALTYNQAGQMITKGGSATYTYAGTGQSELTHQVTGSGITYDYSYGRNTPQGVPTLESLTKNGQTSYFDNDPTTGAPEAITIPGGQTSYYATDGHGSIVALIGNTNGGTVLATYIYDPWGTITASNGTGVAKATNPYAHTAGLIDPSTNWTRHGTRYNDTTTGRWTTQDPITHLLSPDRANAYTFATNNPVNFTDVTGRDIGDLLGELFGSSLLLEAATTVVEYGLEAFEACPVCVLGVELYGGVLTLVGVAGIIYAVESFISE